MLAPSVGCHGSITVTRRMAWFPGRSLCAQLIAMLFSRAMFEGEPGVALPRRHFQVAEEAQFLSLLR
jgi:hypothetical protein